MLSVTQNSRSLRAGFGNQYFPVFYAPICAISTPSGLWMGGTPMMIGHKPCVPAVRLSPKPCRGDTISYAYFMLRSSRPYPFFLSSARRSSEMTMEIAPKAAKMDRVWV